MSRTPARITQADVTRALRAAKQVGAGAVRITSDGTIHIDMQPQKVVEIEEIKIVPRREVVL